MENQCHIIAKVTGSSPVPPNINTITSYYERRF
jgi:hypothetical protein